MIENPRSAVRMAVTLDAGQYDALAQYAAGHGLPTGAALQRLVYSVLGVDPMQPCSALHPDQQRGIDQARLEYRQHTGRWPEEDPP